MKVSFFISLLFLTIFCSAQEARKRNVQNKSYSSKVLNLNNQQISQFSKLEIGLQIPDSIQKLFETDSLNPFNPKHINIEAQFISPTGRANKKVFGFYYEKFTRLVNSWKPEPIMYNWRIRFAPPEIGNWTAYLKTEVAGQIYLDTITFNCIASKSKGFIELGDKGDVSDRYLRFSKTKENFFAVGENMVWPSFQILKPTDAETQIRWMEELAAAKGNFIRLGLIPDAYGFEWEQLGNYKNRMTQAWELDKLFNKSEELGIYLLLWFDIHGQFTPPAWKGEKNSWDNNPYNKYLPQVNTPLDFLNDSTAKAYYKQKIRYLVARWGYSTSLAVYEPLSEIDHILTHYNKSDKQGEVEREALNNWYIEMKNYFVNDLHETRPVSASFTGWEYDKIKRKIFRHVDITFLHNYSAQKNANKNRFKKVQKILNNKHTEFKPILYNEIGAQHTPNLDYATDNVLHNEIWSTSFNGSFGCGMTWWWDNAIHPQGWQKNFKGLANFFRNEDLTAKNYEPNFWQSNFWSFYNSELEMYYLKSNDKSSVLGWLHNNSYWWYNQQNINGNVKKLMDNKEPRNDKADTRDYTVIKRSKKLDKGILKPTVSKSKIKIKGLSCRETYLVNWYSTSTGTIIPSLSKKVRCKFRKLKLDIPEFTNAYGDYGFKVTLVP